MDAAEKEEADRHHVDDLDALLNRHELDEEEEDIWDPDVRRRQIEDMRRMAAMVNDAFGTSNIGPPGGGDS